MIQLTTNGALQNIDVTSIKELQDTLTAATPEGHAIASLLVNGHDVPQPRLDDFELAAIRTLELSTMPCAEMARAAVGEASEWMRRVREVLESVASDYRMGRQHDGASRLVDITDALVVMVNLLQSLHTHLAVDSSQRASFDASWIAAQTALEESIHGLMSDMESGDPVRLADRTGYALPRCIGSFQELLGQFSV
jgi:hypothetical protein